MGRPGAGTSGGGRSGGGFRPSPGGSGARPTGGSSRPFAGSSRPSGGSAPRSSGGSRPSGGGFSRPPSPPPRPRGYGAPQPVRPARRGYEGRYGAPPPPRRPGGYGRGRGGCIGSAAAAVIVVVVVIIVLVSNAGRTCLSCLGCGRGDDKPNSSYNQYSSSSSSNKPVVPSPSVSAPTASSGLITVNKNKPSAAFSPDCIIDELNWFEDVQKAGEDLKFVYDKLGIQPYIVFRKYDSSLVSDGDKIEYCKKWYNENIENEDTFLFMYFAEKNSDKDIGYMAYWSGSNAAKLSDKFESVFEDGINNYWFTDLSTDDVIKSTFEYTCDSINIK